MTINHRAFLEISLEFSAILKTSFVPLSQHEMKVILLSVAALTVLSFASAVVVDDPQDRGNCEEKEGLTCKGEKLVKSAVYKKAQEDCLEEKLEAIQADKKDRQKGITCLVLCEWQKSGVLDNKGKFIEAKSDEMLKSFNLTAPLTKQIKDIGTECLKKHESKLNWDPKDKTCSSYRDLVLCQFESFMKVCNDNYDAEDWAF